ncbi:MAG: hypothetical protein KJS92_08910 [Bacteroidetes bacterium]|nr:hypothetical protein [Bacteroidota bacterium]
MKAILIKPETTADLEFILSLMQKLGTAVQIVDSEELEDLGMSLLLRDADRNQKVSRAEVMKKLKTS